LPESDTGNVTTVTVTTPLMEVVFTSAGGEIVSTRLFEYTTNKEPVQIVRPDSPEFNGLANIRLIGDDHAIALRDVHFEAFSENSSSPLGNRARVTVEQGARTIHFRSADGSAVVRSYTFLPDRYVIRATMRADKSVLPDIRRVEWGFGPGLTATEVNVDEDFAAFRGTVVLGEEVHKHKRGNFREEYSGVIQYAAIKSKYFTAVLLPPEPVSGGVRLEGVKETNFLTAAVQLPAFDRGGGVEQGMDVYLGPLDVDRLKALGRGVEKSVDIGFEWFPIFRPISSAILWAMTWTYKFIPNYGIVIILISVLTKVLFYRLTHKSFKSMRDLQALQPKLQALKEKYKDDRQKMSAETMRIYKEAGVNPLGGCLPMLLQMPVFIALFNVLRNTIEVRRAPFFGWMDDLSQQDVLFRFGFSIPFIGDAFSVLPLLMGVGMLLQSKIGGGIGGAGPTPGQPKAMTYMMPIMFTALFYKMPSGLVIYWIVNTVLSVAQQYYINRGADKPAADGNAGEKPAKHIPAKGPESDDKQEAALTPNSGKSNSRRSKSRKRSSKSRAKKG
jgi:YidC/Oxa1 family membrane protein insertase